jgi:Asp-tRNA(Asn)/Glu-tRNA(Gln) amidotransferase A subunit family amidase
MVPLAIGTQTNGSVIRPASYCGVVGFKPTHGKISRSGVLKLSTILDHVGVFARTLEDTALIAECLMSYDPKDPDTKTSPIPNLIEIINQPPPFKLKFAFVKSPAWNHTEKDTQAAFREDQVLLGSQCEEVTLPPIFDAAIGNLKKIMNADLARFLSEYMKCGEEKISDILRGLIKDGNSVSAFEYNNSVDQILPMANWISELSNKYDAILTPAACGEAPLGLESTGDPIFCSTWTYLGVPAISIPLMKGKNGLPIGLQLVGPRGEDAKLLRAASWLAKKVTNAN